MIENKIIEILMKEVQHELTLEECSVLAAFTQESAANTRFVNENKMMLSGLPTYMESEGMFDTNQALEKVNRLKSQETKVIALNPSTKTTIKSDRKSNHWQKWAAAALFIVGLSTLVYTFIANDTHTMVYNTADEMQTIHLPDGSEVTLNKHSTLTLSEDFGTHLRDMRLEGEAYFKVKNIDNQAFTVQAGLIKVEVLGTEFNIRNRAALEAIDVYVHEGKVKVSNSTASSKVLLTDGQSARFDKSSKTLLKDKTVKVNSTSWLTSKLSFKNISLGQALEDIEAHFGIDITLNNASISKCPYTSLFNKPNPDDVLETLSAVFDVQIIKQGNLSYQLSGGNCN